MFILLVRFHYSVCSLQLSSKITKNYIRKNVEIIEQSARCATRWRFFRKIFTTELENKIWTRSVSNIVWFSFWVWNQRNTDDGVTRNFSEIIYRDEQKKCFHSCFIDYERDFDNVLHDKFARVREIDRCTTYFSFYRLILTTQLCSFDVSNISSNNPVAARDVIICNLFRSFRCCVFVFLFFISHFSFHSPTVLLVVQRPVLRSFGGDINNEAV